MIRRIIIVIALGVVIVFAGLKFLSKSKKSRLSSRKISSDSLSTRTKRGRTAKTSGQIRTKTKEEIRAETKRARTEERKRQRELRRLQRIQEREKRRGSKRTSRKQRGTKQLNQVQAIMTIETAQYVLINGTLYAKGDEIMGRKIVNILTDRIIVNEYGRIREVKIGESVLPLTTPQRTTR